MLNKWTKTIFGIGFALLFCVLCVGFAALQDDLSVTGTASAKANLTNQMAPLLDEFSETYLSYVVLYAITEAEQLKANLNAAALAATGMDDIDEVIAIVTKAMPESDEGLLDGTVYTDEEFELVKAVFQAWQPYLDPEGMYGELQPPEGCWPDEAGPVLNNATRIVFGRFSDYEDSLGTCTASVNIDKLGTGGVQIHYDPNFEDTTAYFLLHTDHEQIIAPTTMDMMFAFPPLEEVYLNGMLDTSRTQRMMGLFLNCVSLHTADLSGMSTENVTNMHQMFSGCTVLTELDLSSFDTAKVTTMFDMFYSCTNLEAIYVSEDFVTSGLIEANEDMFAACEKLKGGKGTAYTQGVWGSDYARIDGGTEAPGYFTLMSSNILRPSFYSERTDEENEILDSYFMCYYQLPEDIQAEINAAYEEIQNDIVFEFGTLPWFALIEPYLREAFPEDLPPLELDILLQGEYLQIMRDATSVTFVKASAFDPGSMVSICIDEDNSGGVQLYYDPALLEGTTGNTAVYIVLADPHKKIVATDCAFLFGFRNLTEINFNNLLDTSRVTSMEAMFRNCAVTELDLSGLDTTNVGDMYEMFAGCEKLTNIVFSENFGANCSNMSDLFARCSALVTLDLSNLNTENCSGISHMFSHCTSLTELDLSHMDTRNCSGDAFAYIFDHCTNLKTIYVNPELWVVNALDVDEIGMSVLMFQGCESLVGGFGTTYDADHVGPTYARVDTAQTPGYFTAKTDDTPLAP